MRVVVEMELFLDVPETDELDDDAVQQALMDLARKPFHRIMPNMAVISYRKVEPWEQIDRLSSS